MYITSAFSIGIVAAYYFDAVAMAPVFLFAVALFFCGKGKVTERNGAFERKGFLLLISYMMGTVCFMAQQEKLLENAMGEGDNARLKCMAVKVERRTSAGYDGEGNRYLHIIAKVRENENEKILIKLYEEQEIVPGDEILVKGLIEKPQGRRNPGCFDYAMYLTSIGIVNTMTAEKLEILSADGSKSPQGRLYIMKEQFLARLEDSSGKETAGLMRAIMFGEKCELGEETLEEFQKNGTAHVLAVSGLHVGIIYGFVSMLWRWKKGILFFGLIMIFFSGYMIMASFSASVVRAVLMVWMHVFAKFTGRRYDISSSAFFVALLMLLHNPMYIFNSGFQMSFLAVLSLALMIPLVKKIYSGMLLGSIAVQAGLLPYIVYTFNYLSMASVFVNVPVIFLMGLIVPSGMCCFALSVNESVLFDIASAVVFGLCRILTEINAMTGIDGVTVFMIKSPSFGWVAAYYLILLVFVSEEGRLMFLRKKRKQVVLMATLVIFASVSLEIVAGNDFKEAEIVFVDVGQGDCIHFRTDDGENYLVDGGGSASYNVGRKTLKPYLLKNNAKIIDGAFVTHMHTDHYKGIVELCREGMVKKLYIYEGNKVNEQMIIEDTGLKREDIVYLYKGQKLDLDENVKVDVLMPEKKTDKEYLDMASGEADENLNSMILKITVKGHSVLATADVDKDCLDILTKEWGDELKCYVVKVPHHGSKYSISEDFIKSAAPDIAVFQVGKNNFGHPSKEAIEAYYEHGATVCRNDESGAIGLDIHDKKEVRILTVKN